MRDLVAILVLASSLVYVPLASAAGPTVTNVAPPSVTLPAPSLTPPPSSNPSCGPGLPGNPLPGLVTPGSAIFANGVCNPFNHPHPMLPWGPGEVGGERYGPVVRYWEQHPQVVYGVVLVPIPQEEATPESEPGSQPESQPQTQPGSQSGAQAQAALEAKKQPAPQDVTVPGSWIVETTRGYVHMPRWVLQEVDGGRYQWAWVSAWFQPK
jgi:hypothetical protein